MTPPASGPTAFPFDCDMQVVVGGPAGAAVNALLARRGRDVAEVSAS